MCNAGAMSLGMQAAGAVTSAAGSIFSAKSQKLGLDLDAYFASINAEGELENARTAIQTGERAEQRQRLETAQVKSSQRAAMGANNVDMTTGSAADRLASTDLMGEIDANTLRLNAAREAAGFHTRASNYRGEAMMKRAGAASISPMVAGVTSLIDNAGKIAGDWYSLNRVGAFSNKPKTASAPSRRWSGP